MWGACSPSSGGRARSPSAERLSAMRRPSPGGSDIAGTQLKNTQRLKAHLVFADECGFLLIPNVRRTWAPRGQTPIVRHRYRRDKISAISAITVSAQRHRVGLYLHVHPDDNITSVEVAVFLRALLCHLRGPGDRP